MKIWTLFLAVGAFAQDDEGTSRVEMFDDEQGFRGERGPKECQGVKLTSDTGIKWQCSARTQKKEGQQRNKKCRGKLLYRVRPRIFDQHLDFNSDI